VELEHAFRQGMRAAAPSGPSAVKPAPATPPVEPTRFITWPLLSAAALILLIAGIGALYLQVRRLEERLARTTAASLDWERQYESARTSVHPAIPPSPASTALAAGPALLFSLNRARGGEAAAAAAPVNQLHLTAEPRVVVVSVDAGEARFTRYRITVARAGGETVWTADHLAPSGETAPAVALLSQVLPAGDYALTVDGCDASGKCVTAGRYAFRVSVQ
jgi:hypothetical protein